MERPEYCDTTLHEVTVDPKSFTVTGCNKLGNGDGTCTSTSTWSTSVKNIFQVSQSKQNSVLFKFKDSVELKITERTITNYSGYTTYRQSRGLKVWNSSHG